MALRVILGLHAVSAFAGGACAIHLLKNAREPRRSAGEATEMVITCTLAGLFAPVTATIIFYRAARTMKLDPMPLAIKKSPFDPP